MKKHPVQMLSLYQKDINIFKKMDRVGLFLVSMFLLVVFLGFGQPAYAGCAPCASSYCNNGGSCRACVPNPACAPDCGCCDGTDSDPGTGCHCGGGGCASAPPSRPCGDCIPEGCGVSGFSPEKKFVQDIKNENEPNRLTVAISGKSEWPQMEKSDSLNGRERLAAASVNLESGKNSTGSLITVAKVTILDWFRSLFQLIVKTVSK